MSNAADVSDTADMKSAVAIKSAEIRSRFTWTDELAEEAKRLYLSGLSANEIYPIIKAPTRNVVIGKLNRMGVLKRTEIFSPVPMKPVNPGSIGAIRNNKKVKPLVKKRVFRFESSVPATVAPIQAEAGPDEGVDIFGLRTGVCRWPIGGSGHLTKFCGTEFPDEGVYCTTCRQRAYNPLTAKQKRSAMRGALWAAGVNSTDRRG